MLRSEHSGKWGNQVSGDANYFRALGCSWRQPQVTLNSSAVGYLNHKLLEGKESG